MHALVRRAKNDGQAALAAAVVGVLPPAISSETTEIDNEFELARAKVQLHYINNNCFVDGEDMLEKSKILKDKPITIIQGRYDSR